MLCCWLRQIQVSNVIFPTKHWPTRFTRNRTSTNIIYLIALTALESTSQWSTAYNKHELERSSRQASKMRCFTRTLPGTPHICTRFRYARLTYYDWPSKMRMLFASETCQRSSMCSQRLLALNPTWAQNSCRHKAHLLSRAAVVGRSINPRSRPRLSKMVQEL
jgi:hypothetical protein